MAHDAWASLSLAELASEITVGFVGSMVSEYCAAGIPFLRSQNIEPFRINSNDLRFIGPEFHARIKKSRIRPGDVVIVRTGTPGISSVVPEWLDDANCADLVIVRTGNELDAHFLVYYLNSVALHHIDSRLVGAVQQHFNVGSARELPVVYPPVAEQREIVGVLRSLDDKIELNRRMNQTLESMARAIFRSWFVDFDPPEANATRIGELIRRGYLDVGDGYRAKNSELSSSGLPFARAGNLKAGFDFTGADYFPAERISAVGAKVSRPGDVVFTSKGTVGRLAYVHVSTRQFVYSPQLCYWRAIDPGVVDSRWLYRWMQFGDFRDQCDEVKGQTDMADYVSLRDQQTMYLSLPDIGTQRSLGDVLGSLGEQVELNRKMNGTLAALRDTLLPKLMSGELRVRDAGKLVGTHV